MSIYVTVPQSPSTHQMTLEELFSGADFSRYCRTNEGNTVTRVADAWKITELCRKKPWLQDSAYGFAAQMERAFGNFNEAHKNLKSVDRQELYDTFFIPKASGGLRRIDAPKPELMLALRDLKDIFENVCGASSMYHTSAFAYIRGRSTIDSIKKHQQHGSKWFLKLDCHGFFPSTTIEFVEKQFAKIFPFSLLYSFGREKELHDALELCFLNGGLPQGTPISPLITNIMMIPIDHVLFNGLKNCKELKESLVYTRYADDILISGRYKFNWRKVQAGVVRAFEAFDAPFTLNAKKTRFGSVSGSNWNLGVMLTPNPNNRDELIMTVGRQKKKRLETMLFNYARDRKVGRSWDLADIQEMQGFASYIRMVEGEVCDRIINHVSQKTGMNISEQIKRDFAG